MRLDITTSLTSYLDRLVDEMVDSIAKDGLVLLKRVLDSAGFSKSPYLKNYEVYAHVIGDLVVFEILLDMEAVVAEDQATKDAIEASAEEGDESESLASSTYVIGPNGPQRVVGKTSALRDARTPARDARRPARDARKNARDRLIEKEVANITPRSARVDRDGRLSLSLRRAAKTDGEGIVMPRGDFQGIIGVFLREISSLISAKFAPGLSEIIRRYG
jgi:hypothetical protein